MTIKEDILSILHDFDKTAEDIYWVGGMDFAISLDEFWALADQELKEGELIAGDLIIMGNGFWLSREDNYEGYPEWEYHILPYKPKTQIHITCLTGRYAQTLMRMNNVLPWHIWEPCPKCAEAHQGNFCPFCGRPLTEIAYKEIAWSRKYDVK